MFSSGLLRRLTLGLSYGTIAFGVVPALAPRAFARLFEIPRANDPATELLIRTVGARDVINGIGIFSAALHGGRVAPWILARAVADGSDTLAITVAALQGLRRPRLLALGLIALGATLLDITLYLGHKRAARTPRPRTAE